MSTEGLERAFQNSRAIMANVKADQLGDATPCQSWDVRGLLNHMIGGAYYFATSVNDGQGAALLRSRPHRWRHGRDVRRRHPPSGGGVRRARRARSAWSSCRSAPCRPACSWASLRPTRSRTRGISRRRPDSRPTSIPSSRPSCSKARKAFIQPAFRGEDTKSPFGAEQPAPANATAADQLAAFLGRILLAPRASSRTGADTDTSPRAA